MAQRSQPDRAGDTVRTGGKRGRAAPTALIYEAVDLLAQVGRPAPPSELARHCELPTQGETRVLRYLPSNLSAREIADELYLSMNTVKLVRRLVVAGSGPGRVPDLPAQPAKVRQVAGQPVLGDDDFLYLFFPETGQGRRAGLASLRRLDARLSGAHVEVAPEAIAAQNAAFAAFGTGVWDRLGELTLPVLVANGASWAS